MKNFSQLKRNLKADFSKLKSVKIALLGDTATQFLVQALKGMGFEYGFDLKIFEADFNQVEIQVLDPGSEFYEYNPEVVIIFQSSHKLLDKYNKLGSGHCERFADSQLGLIDSLYTAVNSKLTSNILFYNYPEINDSVFGSYCNKVESSFLFQLRKLNYGLMVYAAKTSNFFLIDISSIQNQFGKLQIFQTSVYINTEIVFSIDILPEIASKTMDIIAAMYGKFKKCLILDLDNTLWGGIIGDEGLENIQIGTLGIGKAFSEFQYWIKKLKNRGVIIAVCSKNTESVAKEVFEKHPDMILQLDDIAVFIANWKNKVDNIRRIQEIVNISFDSMVFLDDNPFERAIVRENIPGITVPELPDDPADYLEYLYTLNLFETVSFSNEDLQRTKQYQTEVTRTIEQKSFTNEDDFLKSLNMFSVVEPFSKFNKPRVTQLSQRSNQFNLRTVRYTDADIKRILSSKDHFTFSFTLEDKFGEHGLVGVVILKKENNKTTFIETWFMSCRVLNRGMENFMLNTIADFAMKSGFKCLRGEYIATYKNEMVRDHYLNLGFEKNDDHWELNLDNYKMKKSFINRRDKHP